MIAWFVWKKMRSDAMGLWVSELPSIIRPEETNKKIEIPGRAGSLVLKEGEDVYKSYLKECKVVCKRNMDLQNVLNWLRGSGDVIFGNEPNKAYTASILSEVRFEKVSNNLVQAIIPFYVEPFKHSLYPDSDKIIITDTSADIYNPGDVASKPKVKITGSGNKSIVIAGQLMTFTLGETSVTIIVDCDAQLITSPGVGLWTGTFTGSFWKIPKGGVEVINNNSASIEIEPNWRWV